MLKNDNYLWRLDFMVLVEVKNELNNFPWDVIQLKDGIVRNAIVGNIIKKFYVSHLHELLSANDKCDACKIFSSKKSGVAKEPDYRYSPSGIRVKECAICDIKGFLNEERGERRKTVASFSWAIAKEGLYKKDAVLSSQYAMVIELDLHRIGFDDINQLYVLDKGEIKKRISVALKGVENLLTKFRGKHSIKGITGIVTEKTNRMQRMTKFSPLNDNFIEENQDCSDVSYPINEIRDLHQLINRFTDEEFLNQMVERNMGYVREQFA